MNRIARGPSAKAPPRSVIEPIEDIRASFIGDFQKIRIARGEKPAERAVFRKQHGVAKGQLGRRRNLSNGISRWLVGTIPVHGVDALVERCATDRSGSKQ
jgi:hypothetical protein